MMAKSALLSAAFPEKRGTIWHDEDGVVRLESRQNVDGVLEFVKVRSEMPDDKDLKYLGEIPKATLDQALIEGWVDDDAAWRKWFAENPMFSAKWHRGANG